MIAFLADVHIGTKLQKIDYLKSLDMFLDIIKKHPEDCHAIFVVGDLFDHILSIDESRFASMFLVNLVCNNCGRNGKTHVPVHFIHGTYSHDYEQYEIYLPILEKIDNVEIFYTKNICSGKLSNGMSVLYLPQLYGDVDYTEAFSNKYDIIVGHGGISSITKCPYKSSHDEMMLSVEQLGCISKICVFGHYHEFTDFGNNVFYAGSMLRSRYGEDVAKQFVVCNDNFEIETYINPYAIEYKTMKINNPDELRDIISTDIKTPHRFIINTTNDDLQTYHAIMSMNKNNHNLKYRITTIKDDNVVENTVETDNPSTALNVNIGPIPSLISYISERYELDTSKEIHEYEEKINRNN